MGFLLLVGDSNTNEPEQYADKLGYDLIRPDAVFTEYAMQNLDHYTKTLLFNTMQGSSDGVLAWDGWNFAGEHAKYAMAQALLNGSAIYVKEQALEDTTGIEEIVEDFTEENNGSDEAEPVELEALKEELKEELKEDISIDEAVKKPKNRIEVDMDKAISLRKAGWSYKAIGEELNCSEGYIFTRLKAAKQRGEF